MPIDPDRLRQIAFPDIEQAYKPRDVMLYALGIGLGQNNTDPHELAFVYERGLKVLPTYPAVLGFSPFMLRDLPTGIDFTRTVHGEERIEIHRPLPVQGHIVARTRLIDVIDKGAGKGALLLMERSIGDKASGQALATITQTVFCRGDGGFGPVRPSPPAHRVPERVPDLSCDLPTRSETALIYRLSADLNPLHADPEAAKAAGFPRPILHGLASFGVAGHAILRCICDYDPARIAAIGGRFTAPVFPGETIRTEIWRDGSAVSFRARVKERDAVAIDNGFVELQ